MGIVDVHIDNLVDSGSNTNALTFDNKLSNGGFLFRTCNASGTQKVGIAIDKDGKVGIGHTCPNAALLVCGNVSAWCQGGGDAALVASKSDGSTTVILCSNGNSYLTGGRLGIGTASPTLYALHLACDNFVRHEGTTNALVDGWIWDKYASADIVDVPNTRSLNYVAQTAHSGFAWQARCSDGTSVTALSIDRHGSVIVGDAYYGSWSKFTVHSEISSSSADVITLLQHTTGTPKPAAAIGLAIANNGQSTNAADMYFSTASAGSVATQMTLGNTGVLTLNHGTVTLGTAGASSAHFNTTEMMSFNIDTDNNASNKKFGFYTDGNGSGSGTELLTILESGNVGIGCDTPPEKLSVCGKIFSQHDGGVLSGTVYTGGLYTSSTNNSGGLGFGFDTAYPGGVIFSGGSSGSARSIGFWHYSGSAWYEHMKLCGNNYTTH